MSAAPLFPDLPATPAPTKLPRVPRRVARKCPSGRADHQMEPDWEGRYFTHMKCRWCNKREPV